MEKRTVIIGGGTFNPIRNHLSLAAPAFGRTARDIHSLIPGSELVLTRMADPLNGFLTSNSDVEAYIDDLIEDKDVEAIIMNAAICDYEVEGGDFHGERFETSKGDITLDLKVSDKIISKIRKNRPDIFLVGFKTTTGKSPKEQFLIGLEMMKRTKCNLVLANDTLTRFNMVITPEETVYGWSKDREKVVTELVEVFKMRLGGTYNRTNHIISDNYPVENTSKTFQEVLKFLIDNGGYIENNSNGFTPGHFCFKIGDRSFYSSQRKADHNKVFEEGMSLVTSRSSQRNLFEVRGKRKASVGAHSQYLLLKENPEYDCIVHTHNPLRQGSPIHTASQKPFQCGSLECGMNTVNNMHTYGTLRAVYLHKHGINLMFKSDEDPQVVIDFLKDNIVLGEKVI